MTVPIRVCQLCASAAIVCCFSVVAHAQTTARLAWDETTSSTVTGYSVTVDGVRQDYGLTPVGSLGACGCSIPITFSGGTHTIAVGAYNSVGETLSAPLTVGPIASPGGPYAGTVGTALFVDGSASSHPAGTIVAYVWKWGDGASTASSSSATASHTYATAGAFTITLTVTDNAGSTASATTTATVSPVNGTTYAGPTPDGTTVPPAAQIVDNLGAIWTIDASGAILRNGVPAAGGAGSEILWKNGTIYVLGTDNNWWQWTGSGWINVGPIQPPSPDGTAVPPATQIVDNLGAVWTIGANEAILRNGVPAAGGAGSAILWTNVTIYVLGTDNNWWQWTGSGWINVGPIQAGGGTRSPDGTAVPPATQIVDNLGTVWTIGADGAILRNGVQAAGGWGSQILWSSSTVYVLGTDSRWYQWTASGWINVGSMGSGTSASPDGTTAPPATQIVDNLGAIWTSGTNGAILRNGVQAAGGGGWEILWKNVTIYVLGTDNNWWQWTGSGWIQTGPIQLASLDGTAAPPATQIADNLGAIWTIDANGAILRNGVPAAGGAGSEILWKNLTIYVLGIDNNWWQWTGSGWTNVGPTAPSI